MQATGGGYKTDQQENAAQPPLTKAPVSDARIDLPRDFKPLGLEKDLLNVIFNRCSSRVYTEESFCPFWGFRFYFGQRRA